MKLSLRKYCFRILEHSTISVVGRVWGKFWENFLAFLILSNVIAVSLETIPSLHTRYGVEFFVFEFASVVIFTFEYFIRIWSIVEDKAYQKKYSRLKYIFSPFMLFDLMVILPFYLQLFLPLFDMRILRLFRLVRVMRVLRIGRFSLAADKILRVVSRQKDELFAVFFLMFVALLLSSTALYFAEHAAQPDKFSSIPASFWWGISALTTVGYGDMVPITILGKVFSGIIEFFGVAIFALPAAILGASFYQEIAAKNQKEFRKMHRELLRIKQYAREKEFDLDPAINPRRRKRS